MRSIPALAGKPRTLSASRAERGVYPRARGEATCGAWRSRFCRGLSPRSRGSPRFALVGGVIPRSIPALAGKPLPGLNSSSRAAVYPRARGEARRSTRRTPLSCGLSPRSRGSPGTRRNALPRGGSIPALAGKPHRRPDLCDLREVYPRARGEASGGSMGPGVPRGLSPRSRGSLLTETFNAASTRSIPALAGKPPKGLGGKKAAWVYPRARGEATPSSGTSIPRSGLSPRSRGSLALTLASRFSGRSIPALAGKPGRTNANGPSSRVYPRARGEARVALE